MVAKTTIAGSVIVPIVIATLLLIGYDRLNQCEYRLANAFKVLAPRGSNQLSSLEIQAVREWATSNEITAQQALTAREVRTLEMGDQRCVVLLLARGAIGGSPVYCFDQSGVLVSRFDNVE